MPNYQLVKINVAAEDFLDQVTKAKREGNYEGLEKDMDREIMATIAKLAATASGYTAENARLVESERKECQTRVNAAEKLLKDKEFGNTQLKSMEGFQIAIGKRLDTVHQDNSDLTQALAPQYRANGWTRSAEEALSNPGLLKPLISRRAAEVKLGSTVIQQTRRIEEYADRIAEMVKEARVRFDEKSQYDEIYKDLTEVGKQMKTDFDKIDDLRYKAQKKLDRILEINPKKASDLERKTAEDQLPDVQATGKQIRGHLKTMDIRLSSLLKRSKGTPGFVDAAESEIKDAKDWLKKAEKLSKDFDAATKKAESIVGKL